MEKKDPIKAPYLTTLSELINKHLDIVDNDIPANPPSVNDEIEILINLLGLSRVIEYNMRVAYEKLNNHYNLNLPEPHTLNELLEKIEPYITEKNKLKLLDVVRLISNGLVHSNFKKVYLNSKKAYEIDNIDFYYDKFEQPIVMFNGTITQDGFNATIVGDKAFELDKDGKKVPLKMLEPDGTNDIDVDFDYFYLTGSFIFTYDILITAYKESVVFKEDMKKLIINKK